MRRINYCGIFNGKSGYSLLAKAIIGLMNYTPEINVCATELGQQPARELEYLYKKNHDDREQLCHQLPSNFPGFEMYYTVTEFDQPPYRSISPMRSAKQLFTQSEFCKKVFEETCGVDTRIIHYPLDPQFKPDGIKYRLNKEIDDFGFKFISVFEWCQRKDPYTLIEAFVEEFDKDEDVCLLLRCWSLKENVSKWVSKLAPDHNVFWLPETVPQIAPLYRSCDAFVTATQGEGFGQPIAEAMACGLRAVVPKSTGMLDYCDNTNSFLVDVEEKEIKDTSAFKRAGIEKSNIVMPWFQCWEVKKESLKKKMRKAYESDAKFILQNLGKIREKFNYDNIIEEIRNAFEV